MIKRRAILSFAATVWLAGCSTGNTPTEEPTETDPEKPSQTREPTPEPTDSPDDVGFPYGLDVTNYHDEAVTLRIAISPSVETDSETATPTFTEQFPLDTDESVPFENVFDCATDSCRYVVSYTVNDEHSGEETIEMQGGTTGYVSLEVKSPSIVTVRPTIA